MGGSETTKQPLVFLPLLHGSWSPLYMSKCLDISFCPKPWILFWFIVSNVNPVFKLLNLFRGQNIADYCLAAPWKLPFRKSELQVKWCTSPVPELLSFIQMRTRSPIKLTQSKLWPEQQDPWVDQEKWYQAECLRWDLVACTPLKSRQRRKWAKATG